MWLAPGATRGTRCARSTTTWSHWIHKNQFPFLTHTHINLKNYFLESCVTNLNDALAAANNGADRIEICARLETEGMTPDIELVKTILEKIKIPARVMIRETETGFDADEEALQKMISSIQQFKNLPIDGFVIGILKNDMIDRDAMEKIIHHAEPFPITFHKAIDMSKTKWADIKWLNDQILIDTILTSGGAEKALDGAEEIQKIKTAFNRNVMAGGKITYDQFPEVHKQLGLTWYHGRKIVRVS